VVSNLNGNKLHQPFSTLPFFERPREKAKAFGVKQLTNVELLAIMLSSGIKGQSVMVIADQIMKSCGSLSSFVKLTFPQWLDMPGISHVKALQMLAMIELFQRIEKEGVETMSFKDPQAIYAHYRLRFGTLHDEQLLVIKLNHRLQYTGETLLRLGSQASVSLELRDVFVDLLKSNTKKFILVHNHPSGDVTPSQNDIALTLTLIQEARKLGFVLLDHVILSLHGYFSMKEHHIF